MARLTVFGSGPRKYLFWGLLLLIALLLWFEWSGAPRDTAVRSIVVLSDSGSTQRIKLPEAGSEPLHSRYIAESPARRAQVLQNLGEFRAAYKQLAPFLEVQAVPGQASREQLTRRLGSALSHYGLGRAADDAMTMTQPGNSPAPMLLRTSRAHAEIARRLLAALAPYLAGEVVMLFGESVKVDEMTLYLIGEPVFTDDGVALFRNAASNE